MIPAAGLPAAGIAAWVHLHRDVHRLLAVDTYVSSGTGTYTLSVSVTPGQNDCGIGTDAGGSHAAASTISQPVSNCSAGLTSSDTQDWYKRRRRRQTAERHQRAAFR